MVDILIRNVDSFTVGRLEKKAAARGMSLSEIAREALAVYVTPTKAEAWKEIDRIRERNGRMSGDSTADIRADRDNDERYR